MIRRKSQREEEVTEDFGPKGFDDFELRLGDLMRGERATMGKSLLDVQRELRIKASYVDAIENCDPSVFDTPGFIAGYVRSYARYLNMDADQAFAQFCAESGFTTAHGMSAEASGAKKPREMAPVVSKDDPFISPTTPFIPGREGLFSRIEPGAVGSSMVLLLLIGAIGFGGWTVLNEIQRVQVEPVASAPQVLSDLDPIAARATPVTTQETASTVGGFAPPTEALDRIYRPPALEVPVLVSRDAPISTLDPDAVGLFAAANAPSLPAVQLAVDQVVSEVALDTTADETALPQVLEKLGSGVTVIAARPSWVRVRAADGSKVFEGIMEKGDTYTVAQTEKPHRIRVGESGAIYFAIDGQTFGPVGKTGSVTSNLDLSPDNLTQTYQIADIQSDDDLARVVAELTLPQAEALDQ